jgi:hypothetical protein
LGILFVGYSLQRYHLQCAENAFYRNDVQAT